MKRSSEEIENCISLLANLVKDTEQLADLPEEQRIALLKATGEISRPDRAERKKRNKTASKIQSLATLEKNRRARNTTGIRNARVDATFIAPAQIEGNSSEAEQKSEELDSPRNCYVCKEEYTRLHFFYDTMCKKCGDLNYRKRFQTASLHGQVAFITGARLKIGYQATLMMLRAGATVIATTRFPVDAALRYSKEEGYAVWGDRLKIHGLDLRHIPSVEIFAGYVEQRYGRLDILINNAAQTVRRPPGFYAHLMEHEKKVSADCPRRRGSFSPTMRSARSGSSPFVRTTTAKPPPFLLHGIIRAPGSVCVNRPNCHRSLIVMTARLRLRNYSPQGSSMPIFNRWICAETNSWRLRLGEIPTTEMLEVQLVNSVAPFVLCNRLVISDAA